MLDVIKIGHKTLKEKSALVPEIGSTIKELIEDMKETLELTHGIGLAAPQVNVKKRIFITHAPEDEVRVFINPEILQTSQEVSNYEEGCLSIPGVWANVSRPVSITVQARNLNGKIFTMEVEGLLARIIQHEYDHLNGILFTDRLPEKQRGRVLKIYDEKFKKQEIS